MKGAQRRILLVEPGQIGDWLVSQSIVQGTGLFKNDLVDWVVRESVVPLVHNPKQCRHVFPLTRRPSVSILLKLVLKIWKIGHWYDELAVLGHGRSAELLSFLAPATKKYGCLNMTDQRGVDRNRKRFFYNNKIDHMALRAIKSLGLDGGHLDYTDLRERPEYEAKYPNSSDAQIVADSLYRTQWNGVGSNGVIALHTGASWLGKKWPLLHWRELVRQLLELRYAIMLIAGPGEEEQVRSLVLRTKDLKYCWVVSDQSLSVVGGLIRHANIFIGCDSGVTHLAACLNCPTIALFGASYSKIGAPLKPTARLIVLDAMDDCPMRHCFRPSMDSRKIECVRPQAHCLSKLKPDSVISAIRQLIVEQV